MKKNIPPECKKCPSLWVHGIKDGIHNKWCRKYGGATYKKIGHCKNVGGNNQ